MVLLAHGLFALGLAVLGASPATLPDALALRGPSVVLSSDATHDAVNVEPPSEHGRADRGRSTLEQATAAPTILARAAWWHARSWRTQCELAALRPSVTTARRPSASRAPRRCAPRQRDDADDH
jgi:hypothetical protein